VTLSISLHLLHQPDISILLRSICIAYLKFRHFACILFFIPK
jgi:hypothetical protein